MFPPPWFFAPPEAWNGDLIQLPEDEAKHAVRVMRLTPGDRISVMDGAGRLALCEMRSSEPVILQVIEARDEAAPRPRVAVYQGEAKGAKLDDVVERLAELGVAELWAFSSQRSVVRWDELKRARLERRWAQIARGAAKQSRNPYVLEAHPGLGWADLVERVRAEPSALTLWEEATIPMRAALGPTTDRIALVVGPEGGLTRDEAEELADAGAPLVSLGPRILRTENAPVVAASALLFHLGLIG